MNFIDGHCHLPENPEKRSELITKMTALGIDTMLIGGYDPADWIAQIEAKKQYGDTIQMSFGMHPWFVHNASENECEKAFNKLEQLVYLKAKSTLAAAGIGETGLDHALAKNSDERNRQEKWFRLHMDLSERTGLPPVVHSVRSTARTLEILREYSGPPGMIHAFSGNKNTIRDFSSTGFLLSVGPAAIGLKDSADLAFIPNDLLAIESDAPTGAMAARLRGHNEFEPAAIFLVAERMATIRNRRETWKDILCLSRANIARQFIRRLIPDWA
jgi:TatD DNase family protein